MLTAIFVGCVTAYYFGLRAGAGAAVATFLVRLVGFYFPSYAMAIDLCIAASLVVMYLVGSRRPMPPDSALALGWLRRAVKRVIALIRSP